MKPGHFVMSAVIVDDRQLCFFFRRTLQKELSPKYAKVRQKPTARRILPGPAFPAWYLRYSRPSATPPMAASARKTKPVTSNQSWCKTRPKEQAVVRPADTRACIVRLRPACWFATRAAIHNLRAKEMLATGRFYQCSALQ
jgi:hypothetical protein